MPRYLRYVALVVALLIAGAPAWLDELLEDECAAACAGDGGTSCPDQDCTDCAIVCSSCPRTHVTVPLAAAGLAPWPGPYVRIATEAVQRVPGGPPPLDVFHPPRIAG